MPDLSRLFSPINLGSMNLRNRIVMSAMTTNYGSPDFDVTERLIKYHETRAAGGVGLITVEMCSVDISQRYQPQSLCLGEDRFIEGHRELVSRVHALGAKIQPQISHPGPESMSDPVGPSVNVNAGTGWPSRVLELDEIETIIDQYAAAAVRAQQAGYDGIELHAAHAYMLIASFLSPQRNRREDEYNGATFEGRNKFLLDTIRRIKQATGNDFPITLRISGNEGSFDGRELNDTQLLAPLLVEAGIDCIQVSGGVSHDKIVAQIVCGPSYNAGYNTAVASAIKKVVDVPVMVVGRIHDPVFAEQILRDGKADIVMMARPLLADPELPNKAKAGRLKDIRRCLSCENCIDSMLIAPFDANMNCAVNALSGRETELILDPALQRKKVVVIGSGAAGMEAARIAAVRGHDVVLVERNTRLGGSLFFASTVHSDNEHFLDYLLHQMKQLPIEIMLGRSATPGLLEILCPDVIIVETGAAVKVPGISGADQAHVFSGTMLRKLLSNMASSEELENLPLLQRFVASKILPLVQGQLKPDWIRKATRLYMPMGEKVVVVGSDLATIELAEFIVNRGRQVSIVSGERQLATDIGPKRRQEHLSRLDKLGVEIVTGVTVLDITLDSLQFDFMGRAGKIPANTVILAGDPVADTSLYRELKSAAAEVFAIGDCTGLGLIRKATEDAARVACAI